MTKPLTRMYVDHYLQSALLTQLASADRPLRFSEIKEDGIENSLFMYHANKLIARGMITKNDDGFSLTPNGARWINTTTLNMGALQPVKPLVQFVVRDGAGNILLSTRKGQLKEFLNDYMLPGGLHKNGMTADQNAEAILKTMFEDGHSQPQFLSVVENMSSYDDGFIYHSLSHVYDVEVGVGVTPVADERFGSEWLPISTIRSENPLFAKSLFLPAFIEKLENNSLTDRETFSFQYN